MKKTAPSWLFPLVILMMGIVFTALGLRASSHRQALEKSGVTAPGTILGGQTSSGSKGKTNYSLRVGWTEEGGQSRERSFGVRKQFFSERIQGTAREEVSNHVAAPEVSVRFIPGQPETVMLVGGSKDDFGMQYLGYFLCALGLYLFYRSRRRPEAVEALA